MSEAGAFGTVVTFEDGSNVFRKNGEPFPPTAKGYIATEVYLAPPSAQAIEAAAIMKCVEVCRQLDDEPRKDQDYASAGDCIDSLLALITQDGRTQLEEFGIELLKRFNEDFGDSSLEPDFRAIVANLIGEKK